MANEKNTTPTVEEVQAQIQKMLDEAKAQAAEIVAQAQETLAEAKAAADEAKSAAEKTGNKAVEVDPYMEELVEVQLFKDNDKYKEPVFVAVNGENVVIERGVRVKIKRKFAEVLDNSAYQDYQTAKLIEAAQENKKIADM